MPPSPVNAGRDNSQFAAVLAETLLPTVSVVLVSAVTVYVPAAGQDGVIRVMRT